MNEKTEQQKFLEELGITAGQENDVLTANLTAEPKATEEAGTVENKEEDELKARNRRERRLEAKLKAEREAGIQLAAKVEALTASQTARSTEGDPLSKIERLYGTETPEAREATELLKSTLKDLGEQAKTAALSEFRQELRAQQAEQQKEEQALDSMLEEIEDEEGIDLTSDSASSIRKGYLKLLEKMSPKDADGNILQFADHHAVWDVYKSQNTKKTENPAKDLSSRSMVQSGASKESTVADDSTMRYLKENGLI